MWRQWFVLGIGALVVGGGSYGILWLRYESRWAWSEKPILPSECPKPAPTWDMRVPYGTEIENYNGSFDAGAGANICLGKWVTLDGVNFKSDYDDDGGWRGTTIWSKCPDTKSTSM